MTSRVGALVRSFLQTDGDALYLIAGEKIFITRGTTKTVAGREVVSDEAFRIVVEEIAPRESRPRLVSRNRNRLPFLAGEDLAPVAIQFSMVAGRPAMMILRKATDPEGEKPEPQEPGATEVPEPPVDTAGPREEPPLSKSFVRGATRPIPSLASREAVELERLLALARQQGASDLVLSPSERPVFRLQGSLVSSATAPSGPGEIDAFLSRRAPSRAMRLLLESPREAHASWSRWTGPGGASSGPRGTETGRVFRSGFSRRRRRRSRRSACPRRSSGWPDPPPGFSSLRARRAREGRRRSRRSRRMPPSGEGNAS